MEKEVEYCLMVIENAKARGNTFCQVPIWAKPETIAKMVELGYKAHQVGFEPTEPYVHIKF
jgi:hypothetical protein